jgi:hypothetical protein
VAEVTEVKGLGFAFLPLVFGGSEFVAHHFVLDSASG